MKSSDCVAKVFASRTGHSCAVKQQHIVYLSWP
ncbi:MAG: hypothetical protein ACI8R9_001008, partial [Paraglaciecola sp.]